MSPLYLKGHFQQTPTVFKAGGRSAADPRPDNEHQSALNQSTKYN